MRALAKPGTRSRSSPLVLLVEDDPERIGWFERRFRSAVLRTATNYADAVAALAAEPYDLVLLDHDLDDRAHNGQDVCSWMASRLRGRAKPRVVIHSTNLRGRYAMTLTLTAAGFDVGEMPFLALRTGATVTRRAGAPCEPAGRPRRRREAPSGGSG